MKSKVSKIISKVIMAAIGIILIIYPGTALEKLIQFIGIAALLVGLSGVLSYLFSANKGLISTLLFAGAVILILASVIPIARPSLIIAIFPLVIGLVIAFHGLGNAFEAINSRPFVSRWYIPLILSVLAVIAGCIIAFYPFAAIDFVVRIVGIVVVYNAVVGLYMAVTYRPHADENGVIDITDIN